MISIDISSRRLTDKIEIQMKALGFTGELAIQFKINDVEVILENCYEIYVNTLLSNKPKASQSLKLLPLLATLTDKSLQNPCYPKQSVVHRDNNEEREISPEVDQGTEPALDTRGLSPDVSTKDQKTLTDVILHGTVDQIQSAIVTSSVLTEYQNGFLPLHIAAHYGESDGIKVLVSRGAEIEAKTATGEKVTPLHLAAYAGHHKAVQVLVELGSNIEAPTSNGSTPLRLAASQRNVLVTEFLLNKGANSNTQCNEKKTPLYAAIVRGHQGNVKLLLLHGADMTIPTITGKTAIHYTIEHGNAEMLSVLVSANRQAIFHTNVVAYEPPLVSAVKLQKVQHVKILLKASANPNMCNRDKMSPLTIAACFENFELMELLVHHGAEMKQTFPPFGTALHTVAVEGKVHATRKLLKMGTDPNIIDHEGTTPLRRAVENKHAAVVAVLLENGADIHVECPGDELPLLHKAAKRNDIEMLKILIEHGADPYEIGIKGGTAMMTAAAHGSADAVDLLSNYSGLIDILNKAGLTPLMVAINKRNYDCALHLLKHKPNVKLCDSNGNTVLHTCIAYRAPEDVVKAVLGCDAMITTPANNGATPIMLACKHGFFELAAAMLEKCPNLFTDFPNMSATLLCAAVDAGSTKTLEILLQCGAKPDYIHPHMPFTALHRVCCQHNVQEKMLQLILDNHPDLNIITKLGTPLQLAVGAHNNIFVAMLLHNGADPNALNIPERVSPLIIAAEVNNIEAAQLILQHGGRVDYALPSNGYTALHKTASYNYSELAQVLIKKIFDIDSIEALSKVDQRSKDGYTPLHVAISAGSQEVVALLIENDSDINAQDNAGVTPLMRAISEERNEIALTLLKHSADVELCANDGVNALHICARVGSVDIAEKMLNLGLNPDVQESHGITPLALSIIMKKVSVAKVLVEKGASVNLADNEQNTPLHMAAEIDDDDAVKMLLERGADLMAQDKDGKMPKDLAGSKNIEKMMATAAKEKIQRCHISVEEVPSALTEEAPAAVKSQWYNAQWKIKDE